MALGTGELLLLLVLAIMILGPKEVYKIAHKMGGWMREIQKMSQEFMRELNREAESIERMELSQSPAPEKNVFVTGKSNSPSSVAGASATSTPNITDDDPASLYKDTRGVRPTDSPQDAVEAALDKPPLDTPAPSEQPASNDHNPRREETRL